MLSRLPVKEANLIARILSGSFVTGHHNNPRHELPQGKGRVRARCRKNMSHKVAAIPAGCYFTPETPTLRSPAPLTPVTSSPASSRPLNARQQTRRPGISPPPSKEASSAVRDSSTPLGNEHRQTVAMASTLHPPSTDIHFQDIPATVQRKVRVTSLQLSHLCLEDGVFTTRLQSLVL